MQLTLYLPLFLDFPGEYLNVNSWIQKKSDAMCFLSTVWFISVLRYSPQFPLRNDWAWGLHKVTTKWQYPTSPGLKATPNWKFYFPGPTSSMATPPSHRRGRHENNGFPHRGGNRGLRVCRWGEARRVNFPHMLQQKDMFWGDDLMVLHYLVTVSGWYLGGETYKEYFLCFLPWNLGVSWSNLTHLILRGVETTNTYFYRGKDGGLDHFPFPLTNDTSFSIWCWKFVNIHVIKHSP